ncbi:hypothetical protein HAX54_007282 [Datura stramonium]|uniref:Uncharacterized protein n=1 Tax=Datura stramonium TaxID=4076 RepID=A0ABS8TBH8_DATST|nr:hypothetical protein [Datura stramonium]
MCRFNMDQTQNIAHRPEHESHNEPDNLGMARSSGRCSPLRECPFLEVIRRLMDRPSKWQLQDKSESDSPSGSEKAYEIDSSDDSLVVTTRVQVKSNETIATTSLLPQSEEGGEGTESDSQNPHADDAEKGDSDAEEFGEKESSA